MSESSRAPDDDTAAGVADASSTGSRGKYLTLSAMVFAVAMMFIDMTIVAVAIPEIQKDLDLTSTGLQWVINAFLLSLAALIAFGGRLSDVVGHRRIVIIGTVIFAFASAMNGLTPHGSLSEPWIIGFRFLQGAGAALQFPAALAIVLNSFPLHERGRASAIFFGVTGAFTAIGPLMGGYLSEWTWRAIFWVNLPVAVVAIVLIALARPVDVRRPATLDYRGLALIFSGMILSVLGLQQSSVWGWTSPLTIGSIAIGAVLLVIFVLLERDVSEPLIRVRIFTNRPFAVENAVLFLAMVVFVPIFFFGSMYAQISLGWSVSNAGLYLLIFFAGFAPAAQVGGRLFDRLGAKIPVTLGCALGTAGFALWGWKATDLSASAQAPWIVLAGAGIGMMLGPASTDAINRAPASARGEVTGITQTLRNYGSSLGMAILGTLLITRSRIYTERSLQAEGIPKEEADRIQDALTHGGGGDSESFAAKGGEKAKEIFEAIQQDFAAAIQDVFYVAAGFMALATIVALVFLQRGRQEEDVPDDAGADAAT